MRAFATGTTTHAGAPAFPDSPREMQQQQQQQQALLRRRNSDLDSARFRSGFASSEELSGSVPAVAPSTPFQRAAGSRGSVGGDGASSWAEPAGPAAAAAPAPPTPALGPAAPALSLSQPWWHLESHPLPDAEGPEGSHPSSRSSSGALEGWPPSPLASHLPGLELWPSLDRRSSSTSTYRMSWEPFSEDSDWEGAAGAGVGTAVGGSAADGPPPPPAPAATVAAAAAGRPLLPSANGASAAAPAAALVLQQAAAEEEGMAAAGQGRAQDVERTAQGAAAAGPHHQAGGLLGRSTRLELPRALFRRLCGRLE